MNTFRGLSAAEFYSLRDKRTITAVDQGVLAAAKLRVSIDDAEAETYCGQVAFLLALNLNARWCRDI